GRETVCPGSPQPLTPVTCGGTSPRTWWSTRPPICQLAASIDKRIEESRADALSVREVARVAAVALTLTVVHRLFEPFQRLDRTRVDDHHGSDCPSSAPSPSPTTRRSPRTRGRRVASR